MPSFLKEKYTAYATAYSEMKKYTTPKIYHGGKNYDLSKRWYVYYSFVDPSTGQMKQQAPLTMEINRRFKTKQERLSHLKILKQVLTDALKDGYNPYDAPKETVEYTAKSTLKSALANKTLNLAESSVSDYEVRVNNFIDWLDKNRLLNAPIVNIDKKVVNNYLNHILSTTTARNRNNTRAVLSSVFTEMVNADYIETNFIKNDIPKLKTNSKRDRTISSGTLENILQLLKDQDPILLLYIQFISYFFLRPVEVVRLKLKDIDLTDKRIYDDIKQQTLKTKIIPELIYKDIVQYIADYPKSSTTDYLFTPEGIGEWAATETNRRNNFSKRWNKFREAHQISDDITLYSFRHTYVTILYQSLRLTFDIPTTLQKLSLITGHTSDAIKRYIHVLDAELPDDYSHLIKTKKPQ